MRDCRSASHRKPKIPCEELEFNDVHQRFGTFERIGTLDIEDCCKVKRYILKGILLVFIVAISSVAVFGIN